jgi:hypothetical protein
MNPLLLLALFFTSTASYSQQLWGLLTPGKYPVGFKFIQEIDHTRNDRPLLVSLWYPAITPSSAKPVLFKDYFLSGADDFHKTMERPFIANAKIPDDRFNKILNLETGAKWNLPVAEGKFPTVLMSSEPESLSVTAEYLASNGFVVAAVNGPYGAGQPPDSLLWVQPTQDMQWLLNYVSELENIDQDRLAALGFGGGIQSAFFLTMKTDRLKALVNLEGGVFGPRSLTDKAVGYEPKKMKTPMLHIVTTSQRREDDVQQQRALENTTLYKAYIQHEGLYHHDFSIFGRVLNKGLKMRGPLGDIADQTYSAAHKMILEFLQMACSQNAAAFQTDRRYMPFIQLDQR